MEKKAKIMHGLAEIAGQAYYSVKGLRENEKKADLILWCNSPMKYPSDKCLMALENIKGNRLLYYIKILLNFFSCMFAYDVFHFHFGCSLLPKNWDIKILKRLGKKIFVEFHGSEIRREDIALDKNKFCRDLSFVDNSKKHRCINKLCDNADGIILHDDELISHLPEYTKKIYVVPLRLDVYSFNTFYPNANDEPVRIVHAPSNRKNKGTCYIEKAIEELKQCYNIKFVLVENMNQKDAIEEYKKADIIIDQIIIGTYGVFAIEAMAMGKPVITYITDEMKMCFPEELPIVSASPDTIKSELEKLLGNGKLRESLGYQGRVYAVKYHDCNKNSRALYEIYSGSYAHKRGREAFKAVSKL